MVMPVFVRFPNETAAIGRVTAGYGELEFLMTQCLACAIGDLRQALKIFFEKRTTTEDKRINIAKQKLEPHYRAVGLWQDTNSVLEAMNWCKNARNTFSHCVWAAENNILYYGSMADVVRGRPHAQFRMLPLSLSTIEDIEKYFDYTQALLLYLEEEYKFRVGRLNRNRLTKPVKMRQPKLHSPPAVYPRPTIITVP